MKAKDIRSLGIHSEAALALAFVHIKAARERGVDLAEIRHTFESLVADPEAYLGDAELGELATAQVEFRDAQNSYVPREEPAPHRQWGDDLEEGAVRQLQNACELPVSVRGALMPDAHIGYGLPIGGVLATRGAVIPYAVGVDIACRMKMTVHDLPASVLDEDPDRLRTAIRKETRFGIGAKFRHRRQHDVLDEDWSFTPLVRELKDKAWAQLGTSGSGNHFVEFGVLTLETDELGLPPGDYLALLSHSGSRGSGAAIAAHYSKLARSRHPELPRELSALSWLDLDSQEGQEYWSSMELMGQYAAANHACIHRHVAEHLGAEVLLDLENHHNFAWKEIHDGEELIVHRKGATPAGEGVLGIIPGSMASSTYIVRGKGNDESLHSASHGAGRVMSRTKAKKELSWNDARKLLTEQGVSLMSAGLDEVPAVYKDIHAVIAAQHDLVEPLATFQPRLVKMAPAGERPED
ncbi:MAG: RtcB family protein [Thermoanaerobaculia bacterium]|nr:RtcB family protein [Thermoanaerobaculia bacterium]